MQSVSCDESVSSFAAREDGCVRTEKKTYFYYGNSQQSFIFFPLGLLCSYIENKCCFTLKSYFNSLPRLWIGCCLRYTYLFISHLRLVLAKRIFVLRRSVVRNFPGCMCSMSTETESANQ